MASAATPQPSSANPGTPLGSTKPAYLNVMTPTGTGKHPTSMKSPNVVSKTFGGFARGVDRLDGIRKRAVTFESVPASNELTTSHLQSFALTLASKHENVTDDSQRKTALLTFFEKDPSKALIPKLTTNARVLEEVRSRPRRDFMLRTHTCGLVRMVT